MSKKCECLAPFISRLEAGADPDRVIPWDLTGIDPDCVAELCMMYIKYGGETRRKRAEELIHNAGR